MIWIIAVFFPLLLAAVCALPGPGLRTGFRLMPLAPLPALFLAFTGDASSGIELSGFLLKTGLGFGPFGNTFLLFTSLAWFAAALFTALGPPDNLKNRAFCIMFLLTMCGNIGLTASLDAVSFYAFFAFMTFCAFSLIIHSGKELAYRAGRIYLIMAVLGEGLLVAGIITAVFSSPSHFFADIAPAMAWMPETHPVFLLLFAGFGIKAGLIFLHFWLPLAHPVAPTPASAVLSGSMIKAGLLGWMNFFPVGIASLESWGLGFAVLGLGGAFFGALAGLSEKNPKVILAYSSISQMGLMTFCLGLGIIDQGLWIMAGPALYLLVFSHALSKSALFLGTAVTGSSRSGPNKNLLTTIMLWVPSLALAGAPFTGGAQAKYLLKEAAETSPISEFSIFLLSLSSIFTTLLMVHFLRQVNIIKNEPQSVSGRNPAWLLLIIIIFLMPWILHELYPEYRIAWMDPGLIFSSAWPVFSGLVVYLLLRKYVEAAAGRIVKILPDIALMIDKSWYHLMARIRLHGILESDWAGMNFSRYTDQLIQSKQVRKISGELELKFSTWPIFGMFFMLLIIILALLGMKGG